MAGITTYPQLIGITLLLYTCSITGFQEFDSEKCATNDAWNCSQPKLCVEDVDHRIFPGRIKTLLLNLYVPQGLTQKASIQLTMAADKSVIISDAYLAFKDDNTTTSQKIFRPFWVFISGNRVRVSYEAVYVLEDIHCNGSRKFLSTATKSPNDTESPVNTESTQSSVNTESTQTPFNTESMEPPAESTRFSVNMESIESPVNTKSTEHTTETTKSPVKTESTESTESSSFTAEFTFGEPCYCCLLQLSVELLMSNITGVPDNSTRTVNTTFIWDTGKIDVNTILVLKPLYKSSKESNFSTNLLDKVEVPLSSVKTFKLQAIFPNPLSIYTLGFVSPDKRLRIVSVLKRAVGDHYKGIIQTENQDLYEEDKWFCSKGPDTRVINFGYLPNKGAYDSNASTIADSVDFEVFLLMSEEATPGEKYSLVIYLEVDFVVTQNTTKYFEASARIPMKKLVVKQSQTLSSLPVGGTGSVSLTFEIPPLSSGLYQITTSTTNNGSDLDGLSIAGINVYTAGYHFPCIHHYTYWKEQSSGSLNISNIPYTTGYMSIAKTFGFKISILALPEAVKALSTHELTVNLTYPGDGSPQVLRFYFNITEMEILKIPEAVLSSKCVSWSFTSELSLKIYTEADQSYGRLNVEIPEPSELTKQSFALCGVPTYDKGGNIFGRFNINNTKGTNEMIEKSLLEISPLANIYIEQNTTFTPHRLSIDMTVTYINTSLSVNTIGLGHLFPVRISRNNELIWQTSERLFKPIITHIPDFVVLVGFELIYARDYHQNIWFHYSQNGSYFYREALEISSLGTLRYAHAGKYFSRSGREYYKFKLTVEDLRGKALFIHSETYTHSNESCYQPPGICLSDRLKIMAYFYFSSDPCKAICGIEPEWYPLKDYITIVSDKHNTILRMMYYALDKDLDTCFDLPVPGNSPSMFWLRIKDLSLFNVSSNRFLVHITGKGIECERLGQKSMLVGTSEPPYDHQCSIESDMVFCKLVSENTNATLTQCSMKCKCDNSWQCLNVHIIMQNTNKDMWRLCEITINDEV